MKFRHPIPRRPRARIMQGDKIYAMLLNTELVEIGIADNLPPGTREVLVHSKYGRLDMTPAGFENMQREYGHK